MIHILNNIKTIVHTLRHTNYVVILKEFIFFAKFFLLVFVYLLFELMKMFGKVMVKIPIIGKIIARLGKGAGNAYDKVLSVFNTNIDGEISSLDLVILATRHLSSKKHRTMITIGGMAIGFGSVIFLLSIGYGVQNLVVSRVARLGEMKQTDVTIGQASSLLLDDDAISNFSKIKGVKVVLPLVSVVSKVTYNNSVSDAVAYGVTRAFLEESAIQPTKGKIFDDGTIKQKVSKLNTEGQVAGIQTERISGAKMNKLASEIRYSIHPLIWKAVYREPSLNSEVLGYTTRDVGEQEATEVWGNTYRTTLNLPEGIDFFGNEYLPWISDDFPVWKKEACSESEYGCVQGKYKVIKDGSMQQFVHGYMTEDDTTVSRFHIVLSTPPVLSEGEVVDTVQFAFRKDEKFQLYSEANNTSKMLLLFSGADGDSSLYTGELMFGEHYVDASGWGFVGTNQYGKKVGYWIRAKVPLWRKLDCVDCKNLYLTELDDKKKQVLAYAFFPASFVEIEDMQKPIQIGQVLGDTTIASDSATSLVATDSTKMAVDEEPADVLLADGTLLTSTLTDKGTLDWVSISSNSGSVQTNKIEEIAFDSDSHFETLVNRAMLNVLGISENEAIGKTFETVLSLDSDFFKKDNYQAKSKPKEFTIIGVIPEEKTPAYYLPFSDIKNLGIDNYSQVKVVVHDQEDLKNVRKELESMGYRTASVVDTVGKINSLFGTVRLLLSVLGLIALGVAALGMFNTLTVSLLEKTREVGLMKTIGMNSNEVKRLFLAESIIMGLSGGIFGLFLGVITGHILSLAISSISVFKGAGYINLVSVPLYLAFGILLLSFVIGVLTGLYPARRATKISALNALRYE